MHPLWLLYCFFTWIRVPTMAQSQAPQTCVYACLNRFTATADKLMLSDKLSAGGGTGGMSWQDLLHIAGQRPQTEHEMKKNFDEMCGSFRSMKRCVQQCRDIWLRDSVVSGFASIQYVCEDRYQEFITHLPCLAAKERLVVERCSRETNQTAAAIAALERTVFRNDVAKMTNTLAALCRNTSQIVDCLTPATKEMCGKRPASILRRLVTLGFRSIEQMYRRMKIEDKLPEECAALAHSFDDNENEDGSEEYNKKQDLSGQVHRPRMHATQLPGPRGEANGHRDRPHQQTSNGGNSLCFGWLHMCFLVMISVAMCWAQSVSSMMD